MSQVAQKALLRNVMSEKLKSLSESYILDQSLNVIDKVNDVRMFCMEIYKVT